MKARQWFVGFLLVGAAATHAEAPRSLWLRIESVTTSTTACRGGETETFISRDGLVAMRSVGRDGVVTFLRATAPREAVQDLAVALRENRVGLVHGNCALDIFQPGDFFTDTITWLGRSPRSHTFMVTSPIGEPCGASENAIFEAIQHFVAAALSNPTKREVVEIQGLPTPPCDR